MAIRVFRPLPKRSKIAYVGPLAVGVSEAFTARGFELVELNSSLLQTAGFIQQVDSALFFQNLERPSSIGRELEAFAGHLLAHDCRIYVQPLHTAPGEGGDYGMRNLVNAVLNQNLPHHGLDTRDHITFSPVVYFVPNPCEWQLIANIVTNNPAGPGANTAINIAKGDGLLEEERILVQRAFHDCKKVELIPMVNGMSGVSAYRIYAELKGEPIPSSWPYVYFMKVGDRDSIEKEYKSYREAAMGHIPYHLGPRLKLERCALGYKYGILVSDFVVGAETLRDCARDGRGAPAIGNLFSTTTASWRSGASKEPTNLAKLLEPYLDIEVPKHRESLMRGVGASMDVDGLRVKLRAITSSPTLTGLIHGDLHATNVLIRGSDAIIIDFEKLEENKPVLLDAASLEAGLFVDGFVGEMRSSAEILASLRPLYSVEAINGELLNCHPMDGSSWFFDCVRQIRLHAKPMELAPNQYALTLACLLAKKACNKKFLDDKTTDSNGLSREAVRAMAMVLAEQIFEALTNVGEGENHVDPI